MTHFWITGGPSPGAGTDNTTVRYYIDGETDPSIEFKPPMATGAGFDDLTVWGTSNAGHGAKDGAWFINYRIPFQKHVRVTLQHPGTPATCYAIVRGCENLPLSVGGIPLPTGASLRLHKIESRLFQPLDWVPIVDLPSGDGLVFMHTLAVQSANQNFLEGCYRAPASLDLHRSAICHPSTPSPGLAPPRPASPPRPLAFYLPTSRRTRLESPLSSADLYTPHTQSFPGTVLSTGTEDYFDSAYYFDGGTFRFPVAGNTHQSRSNNTVQWSAYRYHETDPLAFSGGLRLVWRVGDLVNSASHPESPKCFIDQKGPGDKTAGNPQPSLITSYAWVYTW
jgi:hypothetical protein